MREYPDSGLLQEALANEDEATVRKVLLDARQNFDTGVAIVMPSYDRLHPAAAESMRVGQRILEKQFDYCHAQVLAGSLLPDARESLAEISVAARTRFTFWMDADMEIPAEAWLNMAELAKTLYYPSDADPEVDLKALKHATFWISGMAYPRRGDAAELAAHVEVPISSEQLAAGVVVDAAGVGLGAAVVPTACMALTSSPLFERAWEARRGRFVGEDLAFCRKLRKEHDASVLLDLAGPGVTHLCEERRDLSWYAVRRRAQEEATAARKIRDGRGVDGDVAARLARGEKVSPEELEAEQERMRGAYGEGREL